METKTIIGIVILVLLLGVLVFFRIRNQRRKGRYDG